MSDAAMADARCDMACDTGQGSRERWGLRIPLRDGVHLGGTLYLPAEQGTPGPAICTLTPYIAQTYHDVGRAFAAAGYPFLAIDVRGRGNSEGLFRPGIQEGPDGHDAVQWIGAQPWCDGRAAMWGGSYSGHLQWATARERPAALAAIAPVASLYWGHDFPARGHMAAPYLMQWLSFTHGRALQDDIFWDKTYWAERFLAFYRSGRPFAELDRFLGLPSEIFQDWIARGATPGAWDAYNPRQVDYDALDLPVLSITGAYDGDQPGVLRHYREHLAGDPEGRRRRHQLVIGPWDHAGTRAPKAGFCGLSFGDASLVDLIDLHRSWYDWVLKDGPRPDFLADDMVYYVAGAEVWRNAPSLEAATERRQTLYLAADAEPTDVFRSGRLVEEPGAGLAFSEFIHDPADESLAALEAQIDHTSKSDQRLQLAASGKQFVFHSAPVDHALTIAGFFRLLAWLSIDQADMDFRVSVHAIMPDGAAIQLAFDTMRARYREGVGAEQLMECEEPLAFDFSGFFFVARTLPKGSRLRLVINCVNSIYAQRNRGSGKPVPEEGAADARPVRVRLYHDAEYPSRLEMPIAAED
jgi:putative CocE/NonD family hydrolase